VLEPEDCEYYDEEDEEIYEERKEYNGGKERRVEDIEIQFDFNEDPDAPIEKKPEKK